MNPDPLPRTASADGALPPDPEQDPALRPSGLSFAVVGLGASAGGTQALTRFFEHLPADSGMGFVVVMHLSPSHASHLSDILGRVTKIPVNEVTEAVAIEANHVYVIPPGRMLWMNDGRLHLRDEQRMAGRNVAIDSFFRVLAQVHRQRAIAIVLSGTGTDGAVGLKRIKELGGVALAQSPADAEHRGMPDAAIATGLVDFVLAAAAMPDKLLQLAANAQAIRLPADPPDELRAQAVAGNEEEIQAEAAMNEILTLLRKRTHHDFSHYKRPTVLRRLERRLQVTATPSLPAYRDHLREHPEETPALLQDMLISVTNFFRDRESFEALEREVLPHLHAATRSAAGLRAWVVGCASGEEAYSLAMLLQERPRAPRRCRALPGVRQRHRRARAGASRAPACTPGSIAADVSPARLQQFFVPEGDHFRVKKSLRERVLFAQHNVLREPPFSRVDLISCRNLLIYLNRAAPGRRDGHLPLCVAARRRAVPGLLGIGRRGRRAFRRRRQEAPPVPAEQSAAAAARAGAAARGGASGQRAAAARSARNAPDGQCRTAPAGHPGLGGPERSGGCAQPHPAPDGRRVALPAAARGRAHAQPAGQRPSGPAPGPARGVVPRPAGGP